MTSLSSFEFLHMLVCCACCYNKNDTLHLKTLGCGVIFSICTTKNINSNSVRNGFNGVVICSNTTVSMLSLLHPVETATQLKHQPCSISPISTETNSIHHQAFNDIFSRSSLLFIGFRDFIYSTVTLHLLNTQLVLIL